MRMVLIPKKPIAHRMILHSWRWVDLGKRKNLQTHLQPRRQNKSYNSDFLVVVPIIQCTFGMCPHKTVGLVARLFAQPT